MTTSHTEQKIKPAEDTQDDQHEVTNPTNTGSVPTQDQQHHELAGLSALELTSAHHAYMNIQKVNNKLLFSMSIE